MTNNNIDNKENIKVIVRIRPKIEREFDQGSYIKVDGNSIITNFKNETKQYTYDYIATEESTQTEIFDQCARNIADSTLQGYNGTIFVYGQTGAGKTFTLLGPKLSGSSQISHEDANNSIFNGGSTGMNQQSSYNRFLQKKDEEGKGVLPRVIDYLFEKSKTFDNSTISFSCSFLEIYQEQISDLLDANVNKQISVRDLSDSVIVEGLSKIAVASADETLNLVSKGLKVRHVGSTNMNKESSRSHAVFSIYIENKTKTGGGKLKTKKSVFNLIDLAGSERQKMTEAYGERLKEAGKINKSLMQLGHVIKSLIEIADGKKCHIHYRDSKLTHLLKDSLGGNSKTCIIANISPANCNYQETISTLIFAQSAKLIKNKAVINEEFTNDNAYKEEIKKLRDKYNTIKAENLYLLSIIEKNKQNDSNKTVSQKQFDFSNTLDYVEEEIETIVNEMVSKEEQIKILQDDNKFLQEKVQSTEIELKLKEKELRELREISRTINDEHDLIKTQLTEYVLKDAYMNQKISQLESLLQNKEFMLNKEIDMLKSSIEENKRLIETKENIISTLNGDIKNYMVLINQRDAKINELKTDLDNKQQENEELKFRIMNQQDKEDNLISQLEYHKSIVQSKEEEVKQQEQKMNEFKQKGKNLVDQYDSKIDNLKLKNTQLENDFKKVKFEIRNLNTLISDLKKERDAADEKAFRYLDDIKRITLNKETLQEDNFRLLEEIKAIRMDNLNLREENEILSENKNSNANKVSLLNKFKQENLKLKDELNDMKKNFENLDKVFNLRNNKNKINLVDFANNMSAKESDLNECRRILHHSVQRINNIFQNSQDEFCFTFTDGMKNYIDSKSIEEKFVYFFEKLLKYQDYKEKKEYNLRKELEAKDGKILSLNREIFLRNAEEDQNKENNQTQTQVQSKGKTRYSAGSKVINSVLNSDISKSIFNSNKKRKFAEIPQTSGFSSSTHINPYTNNIENVNSNNLNFSQNYSNIPNPSYDKEMPPSQDNIRFFKSNKNNNSQVNGSEDNIDLH